MAKMHLKTAKYHVR